jgi:predicted MPP superfamily phosphohydrolase
MKIGIIQLSDLHLRTTSAELVGRIDQIVSAVRRAENQPEILIVALTGDIVWSGKDEEYELAYEFLNSLLNSLKKSFAGVRIHAVAIPGNHDCDFDRDSSTRRKLVESFGSGRSTNYDASEVEICLSVQHSFFEFRDTVTPGTYRNDSKLYYEYVIDVDSTRILLRCCNTAWQSQKDEVPGHIFYPAKEILAPDDNAALVVTMFHHPYNWLTPNSGRAFRNAVEQLSDIVLSGHEHIHSERQQKSGIGATNLYLEADALNDTANPEKSGFNVIVVDLDKRQQKVVNFSWSQDIYVPGAEPAWSDYQGNKLRLAESFVLRNDFSVYLNDLGIGIEHSRRGPLRLPDVFVYPDIREIIFRKRDVPLVSSSDLFEISIGASLLITGPERSGKTSLAKSLFVDFRDRGLVPVLVDGERVRAFADDRLFGRLGEIFGEQYETPDKEKYLQLPKELRVLIVDDFEFLKLGKGRLEDFIKTAASFAGRVIVISEDIAQRIKEIIGRAGISDENTPFRQFQIQQFGHARRVELIERWLDLDPPEGEDLGDRAHRLMQAKRTMDTAIGRNYIPAFPVFLLPILQAQDLNSPVDLNASTYGYFYELLIRTALARGSTREGFDIKMGYLAFVAFELFTAGKSVVLEQELREIHRKYESAYGLRLDYIATVEDFERCGVLQHLGDEFWFRYKYFFYYFVASFIRDSITEASTQSIVANLSQNLTSEDNANILLFLAHLSKHPFILDQMLQAGRRIFPDTPPEELRGDLTFLEGLEKRIEELTLGEKTTEESRREIFAKMDKQTEQTAVARREARSELQAGLKNLEEIALTYSVAFRTLGILGQVVKNFPGSMPINRKLELVRECYGIGLRTLGAMFKLLEASQKEFVEAVREALAEEGEQTTISMIKEQTQASLSWLAQLVALSTVVRTSYAVGSPHLAEIYDKVREEDDAPAVALIDVALHLEQFREFPRQLVLEVEEELRDNFMAYATLRSLVFRHLSLVDVKYDVKQRICEKLKIDLKAVKSLTGVAKLLKARSS